MKINVAEDFSMVPGGRYRADGPWSGEQFLEEVLVPAFQKLARTELLEIDFDGVFGCAPCWISEVFYGLGLRFPEDEVAGRIVIVGENKALFLEDVRESLREGLAARSAGDCIPTGDRGNERKLDSDRNVQDPGGLRTEG
ncbi:MAG: DUF4325 domain-containing protein [Candidatus Hydrogenedentes bacterium]|nr:DUF4325 domain-containing protein [Candidatus Hydrogenedentota bacterium]